MARRIIRHAAAIPLFLTLATIAAIDAAAAPAAKAFREPVVARTQMRFAVGDKEIDRIDKGDLLTVLDERPKEYLVSTFRGTRGLVEKTDVVKLAEAVEIYSELIEAKPEEGRLYTLRASAWWARGDEKRALADFDKAIEAGFRAPHAYSSRGLFHAALGNHEKAVADFTQAIELGAEDATPYINRAAVYMTRQEFDLAVKDYTQAINIQPENAGLHQQRAVAWKLSGKLDDAAADFSRAIELEPKSVEALMGRGFVWFQRGEYQKAIDDFSAALELDPKLAPAYNNRGYNRQLLGDHKSALADYRQAILLAPEYSLAHQNLAWLLAASSDAELRDGRQAVEAATKACQLSDYQDPGAIKALAAALAEAGQYDKAIGWQEKVVEAVAEDRKPFERKVLKGFQAGQPYRLDDGPEA